MFTTNLDQGHYQSRISVANGYHGINVAALGPFFEIDTPVDGDDINGWPLFDRRQTLATIGGFWDSQPTTNGFSNGTNYQWLYQYGGESVISGIPHWGGLILDLGGDSVLDASTPSTQISSFVSILDLKQGLMNWAFTWTPKPGESFNVTYQLFAHRLHVNQGFVSMNVTATKNTNATLVNVLNGDCAVRTTFSEKGTRNGLIYTSVSPRGLHNISAYVFALMSASGAEISDLSSSDLGRSYVGNNLSSIAQHTKISLKAGQTASVFKYVGLASSDGFENPSDVAASAAISAMKTGFTASLQSHLAEWAATFPESAVDDYSFPQNGSLPDDPYVIESAITAVTNPFHLLQNTLTSNALATLNNAPINHHSISVGGLGSGSYAGQIFWDAEIWMQPGLVAAFPFAGQGIANYRTSLYDQAKANVKTAYQSSQKKKDFSAAAAVFPWTSARFGNCTGTGPCFDYEYHINGDIGLEMTNYWVASGDTKFFQNQLFPVYDSIATFYSEVLTKNGSQYELTNMTDPDEFANMVNNGAYTMALINTTLTRANMFRSMFGMPENATWTQQAQNVVVSRDNSADLTLEYTSMNGSIEVKQADVVLNTYPLDYIGDHYAPKDSLSDLDYYAGRQSPNGPAMTYAIFSIIANEVSPSGCAAFTYQQYSENPYVRGPWFQFSEQLVDDFQSNGGTHPAYPFLTGHGGANQVTIFGYLGLRYVPDFSLHVDPALPPQIPQIQYRTFHWQGWAINAASNQTHTTMSRASGSVMPGAVPNSRFSNTAIPIIVGSGNTAKTYSLPVTGSVTIPNRQYANLKTVANNILQCSTVTSTDDTVPGQFPLAAVDGASSTKWQPSSAAKNASITVALEPGLRVKSMIFDWGQAPPVNYSVTFQNTSSSTSSGNPANVASGKVKISHAYDASKASQISTLSSNTTTVMMQQELFTGQYATLTIWGTQVNGQGVVKETNGTGATVAEWSVVVEGSSSAEEGKRDVARNMRRDSEGLERLSRVMARDPRWR